MNLLNTLDNEETDIDKITNVTNVMMDMIIRITMTNDR